MNSAARFGVFALGLAIVFGGALGVGSAVGPIGAPGAGHPGATAESTAGTAPAERSTRQARSDTPGGLQVSENGYTLTTLTTVIKPGEPTDFRFSVTGPDGRPVTEYEVAHDKKLHLVVVSRDLAAYRHLHPVQGGDGVWSVELTLPAAGTYRAFADFVPAGGGPLTLGADLLVAGDHRPEPPPRPARTTRVDGYEVTLDGELTPGQAGRLTLTVSKDGEPITDLQPYLGAYGHLVALRAGDLAYLHVHPDGEPGDGTTRPGPEIVFHAEVPSVGAYRLFLDFRHRGAVRTADFTVRAGEGTVPPSSAPTPAEHGDHTH